MWDLDWDVPFPTLSTTHFAWDEVDEDVAEHISPTRIPGRYHLITMKARYFSF